MNRIAKLSVATATVLALAPAVASPAQAAEQVICSAMPGGGYIYNATRPDGGSCDR
jgi:hypothetical protein